MNEPSRPHDITQHSGAGQPHAAAPTSADELAFGTGLLITRIAQRADGRWQWRRAAGPDRPGILQPSPLSLLLRELSDPHATVLLAQPEGAGVEWIADSPVLLGSLVPAAPASVAARDGVARLAVALAAIHATPVPRDADAVDATIIAADPPGIRRLHEWLPAGDGPRDSRRWWEHLTGQLGSRRWSLLLEASHAIRVDEASTFGLVHGWASLGNAVVVDDDQESELVPVPGSREVRPCEWGPRLQLLTGPDLAYAVPEADVGWVLGELDEFAGLAERADVSRVPFEHLAHIIQALYPAPAGSPRLRNCARVARVALHSADFARYVGGPEALDAYGPIITDLIDQLLA